MSQSDELINREPGLQYTPPLTSIEDTDSNASKSNKLITNSKEAAAFAALRFFDNAIWIGAAGLGVYAEQRYGTPAVIVAPIAATTVTSIDYATSRKAVDVFWSGRPTGSELSDHKNSSSFIKAMKEIGSYAYAAWAGAGSSIEINNTLNLESTRTRRLGQAAIYGLGVSLWTTEIPPFKQGRETVISLLDSWRHNPLEGSGVAFGSSLAIFGGLKGAKATVKAVKNRRSRLHPNTTDSK